jgi:hypothetical protein
MVLVVLLGHVIAFLHDLTSPPRFATDENCVNLQNESSEYVCANSDMPCPVNLRPMFCGVN